MSSYNKNNSDQNNQGSNQKQYTYKPTEEILHWIDKKMFKVLDALDKIVALLSARN